MPRSLPPFGPRPRVPACSCTAMRPAGSYAKGALLATCSHSCAHCFTHQPFCNPQDTTIWFSVVSSISLMEAWVKVRRPEVNNVAGGCLLYQQLGRGCAAAGSGALHFRNKQATRCGAVQSLIALSPAPALSSEHRCLSATWGWIWAAECEITHRLVEGSAGWGLRLSSLTFEGVQV